MDSTIVPNPPLPAYRLRIRVWIILWLLYFYSRWFVYDNYYSRLDNINLIFHEAGHPLMSFFGEFIQFAGGTIFQLLIPTIIMVHLWRHRSNIWWQLCLFWIGQNLLNISIYASDAVNQALPLLGWEHDWAYMLWHLWMLDHTAAVGHTIFFLWSFLIFAALWIILYEGIKRHPISMWYGE